MYCETFGLAEKPFNITPNPRYIFLSKNHKEVFAHLLFGVRNHSGFIEVTGEVGTGKTTVLRTLLSQLGGEGYRLALIFNPSLSSLELLRSINREFAIPADAAGAGELLATLNAFLLQENSAGRTVVLVIDEAQNLEAGVLEQIRLLSNLETETDKLIQIVLVGQPELATLLERPELRQLSQRITVRYHLRPMDFEDTAAYIEHRLMVAGGNKRLFTSAAVRKIYRFSKGYPRLINILCDRGLLVAYAEDAREVSASAIATAISELRRVIAPARRRLILPLVLAATVLLLGTLALVEFPPDFFRLPRHIAAQPEPPAVLLPVDGGQSLEALRRELAGQDEGRGATRAFNVLAALWGAAPVPEEQELTFPQGGGRAASERSLSLTPFRGSVDTLRAMDVPLLLELSLPGTTGHRYLALVSVEDGSASISPPLAGRDTLTLNELRELWFGHGYILWKNSMNLPYLLNPGMTGPGVAGVQRLLQEAGVSGGEVNGIFDEKTISAVTVFQRRRGIAQDGRVGPQTLLLLYQEGLDGQTPRLGAAKQGGRR